MSERTIGYIVGSISSTSINRRLAKALERLAPEGTTLVLAVDDAAAAGLTGTFRCAWITLDVDSALDAVGLTAAVATALADRGISCNMVAGLRHDHLFVPVDRAHDAVAVLEALARRPG